jgi:DNA-binding XRE family transcriptional regulator
MPLNQGNLAQNVRRLAGMHLASMERLAQFIGISRQTMQSIVAHDPHHRSLPRADTAIRLAEAFGVSLNSLYSEPEECLREAVENFEAAPIRDAVEVPTADLAPGLTALHEIADIRKARRAKGSSQGKGKK